MRSHPGHRTNTYGPGWQNLAEESDGCCFLCGSEYAEAIDHDHITGVTRGLLCTRCNSGLGKFFDDPEFLRHAAAYLEACYNDTTQLLVQRYAVRKQLRRSRRKYEPSRHRCSKAI